MKKEYNVKGMTCAACQSKVEKTSLKTIGVTSSSVNLILNKLLVEVNDNFSEKELSKNIKQAGYELVLKESSSESIDEKETNNTLNRLISSIILLLILMYFSMFRMLFKYDLFIFNNNMIAVAIIEMLITIIIMYINKKFFISGFNSLKNLSPNMDTLVALGSGISFIYSLYQLFMMTNYSVTNEPDLMHKAFKNLYFESSSMILTLITIGKTLEAYSKGKTTKSLKSLMELKPNEARILIDGKETLVSSSTLKLDDIFIIKEGDKVAVDAIIIEGEVAVDNKLITGESIYQDATINDNIYQSSIVKSGYAKCKVVKVDSDSTLSQIIEVIKNTTITKAPINRIADKVSGIFVPIILLISLITFIVWIIISKDVTLSMERAVSVLVISCPCSLGLATPVAIMVASGVGAKNKILFKDAEALENLGKCNTICLDKTGTITKGDVEVVNVKSYIDEDTFLKYAYSLEAKSSHPISEAIVKYAINKNCQLLDVANFTSVIGSGIKATINEKEIIAGNYNFISKYIDITNIKEELEYNATLGYTPLIFIYDNSLIGIINVADKIKEDSIEAISEVKKLGLKVAMLTGDNPKTAKAIGDKCGIDEVYASLKPNDKLEIVKKLKTHGMVIMVGDGVNDSSSLNEASIGISMAKGSDIAMEYSNVCVIDSSLQTVANSIKLSRATITNIKENLFWAFLYNSICIPIACGIFSKLGLNISPMLGALAMSLSSVCVCLNALRLNLKDITKKTKHQKRYKERKIKTMEKEMIIEGMMCPHCEKAVKTSLEQIEGVVEAKVSHVSNNAIVTLSKEVSNEALKKVVEAKDYKVISIK